MNLVGMLLYMGVVNLPAIRDNWNTFTRISQVADVMSSTRFKLLRTRLHFNNNDNAGASNDRFFKVRPVFDIFVQNCKTLPETPLQSVDEVMVANKGTRAGNLRQYISTKPDQWGFKLFCRTSSDNIIHVIIVYQGTTTFNNHDVKLTDLENKMNLGSKLVVALVKTLKNSELSTLYADNYFSSLDLASYLKQKFACRYTGTIRENRIGLPNLCSTKEMNRSSVPRGTIDFKSKNGIVVVRWKDNKVVTLLSTDCGVRPFNAMISPLEQRRGCDVRM